MTREEFLADCDAWEAAALRKSEWVEVTRRLDALYKRRAAGDDSVLTAQRIRCTENLQQALMGFPEALANKAAPARSMRA